MPERGRRETAGLSIGALRCFVAVVDVGSFSKAAQALGISQPNVSNQISALEQACGVRLIHRRSQAQVLTDAGRELYVRARLVVTRMDDFESLASAFGDLKRGRIVIGFSTPPVALRLIGEFMRAFPDVHVGTRLGNTDSLVRDVFECRVDAALVSVLEPDPTLASRIVAPQRLNLLMPAGHPLAGRKTVIVKDLVGAPLVSREEGSVTRALTEAAFQQAGVPYRPLLVVESREAVKEAVANGVGLGAILDGEIGEDARLRAAPVGDLEATAKVCIVTLKESLGIPAVEAFVALASAVKSV